MNSRSSRLTVNVRCKGLLGLILLGSDQDYVRVGLLINDSRILLNRRLVSLAVRIALRAGITINGSACRFTLIIGRKSAASVVFYRRIGHVLCTYVTVSNRKIVGRAVLNALRSDCLADLLLSERILVSGASATLADGNGNRLNLDGDIRDNYRGEGLGFSIA